MPKPTCNADTADAGYFCPLCRVCHDHTAAAAAYVATEVAWNGSASHGWIAAKLAAGRFDVDAERIVAYAVEVGLLRPIPRLGGYTVGRKVNARVFGEGFAAWVAA